MSTQTEKDVKNAKNAKKESIHPKYEKVAVTCSCGNVFETRSTLGRPTFHVEVCSQCHPFYTGNQKMVDTAGRLNKHKERFGGRSILGGKKAAE
jgi:large subunit ribosomal protein L31